MRKWLIGIGSLVFLLALWSAGRAGQSKAERPGAGFACYVTVTPEVCRVAWLSGIGARSRSSPYRWSGRRRHAERERRPRTKRSRGRRSSRAPAETENPTRLTAASPGEAVSSLSPTPVPGLPDETAPAKRRRGKPATVPTAQVFCPTLTCRGYGQVGPHPDHHVVGCGTYDTRSGRRQLYRCQFCRSVFSETQGTVFFGLKTDQQTVYRALCALAEGLGVRATARTFGVKPDDVLRWLRRAGQHTEQVSAYLMRNLHVEQAQLDELWTFVRKKEKTLSAWEQLHTEYGDTWIWTVVDPVNKLVLAFLVGERGEAEAVGVLQRLKAVLAEGCLPLFTSDQLPHYLQALLQVFGRWVQPARRGTCGRFPKPRPEAPDDLHYATVHKERQGSRVVSVTRRVVFGQADELLARLKASGIGRTINTAFVERMNLTLRHLVSRLKRRGLNFSKKREYLVWHLQLAVGYYHFVRTHRGLRQRLAQPVPTRGTPKKWAQRTPAMAAGLTDHVWTMQELLMFHVPPLAA